MIGAAEMRRFLAARAELVLWFWSSTRARVRRWCFWMRACKSSKREAERSRRSGVVSVCGAEDDNALRACVDRSSARTSRARLLRCDGGEISMCEKAMLRHLSSCQSYATPKLEVYLLQRLKVSFLALELSDERGIAHCARHVFDTLETLQNRIVKHDSLP